MTDPTTVAAIRERLAEAYAISAVGADNENYAVRGLTLADVRKASAALDALQREVEQLKVERDALRTAGSMAAGILRALRDLDQFAHDGQRLTVIVTLEELHAALDMDADGYLQGNQ